MAHSSNHRHAELKAADARSPDPGNVVYALVAGASILPAEDN
jgi:hypothetical protein